MPTTTRNKPHKTLKEDLRMTKAQLRITAILKDTLYRIKRPNRGTKQKGYLTESFISVIKHPKKVLCQVKTYCTSNSVSLLMTTEHKSDKTFIEE